MQVITREEIAQSGAITAAEIMSHVSANLVGRTDAPYNTSVGNTQAGLSSANLRGLGDGSTLVLLNGRRAANYAANGGAVNLNFIPVAAIERIEILKDGASAIYGADAMAGVVNFILRKHFIGAQLSAYGAATQHGGGDQTQASVSVGYGDLSTERFNVFVVATYQQDDVLHARDRPFSRTGYRPDEGANNTNLETFPANIRTPTLLNPAFASGCLPPVAIPIPGTERCGHDTLAVVNIIPPAERTNVLGGATWQIDADLQLFAQYLYAYDRYVLTRNQAPSSDQANPDRAPLIYPAGGPFYPAEFAAAHGITGDLNLLYRTVPLGPITDKLLTDAEHVVLGAQGSFASWTYDAAWIYSENTQKYFGVSGRVSERRLLAAMATGLINPFGPSGAEGDALLASTEAPGEVFHNKGTTNSVEVKASRDDLRPARGSNCARARCRGSTRAARYRLFAGANLRRHPRVHHREIDERQPVGWRCSSPSCTFRSPRHWRCSLRSATTITATSAARRIRKWRSAGSRWRRCSSGPPTGRDFACPRFPTCSRRCRSDPRLFATTMRSDARPPTSPPIAMRCSRVLTGGNLELNPEKSEQFNVGAVWEPVPGLSLGVDYWKINKTATIGAFNDATLFKSFDRFGDTNFVRGPVDPAFPDAARPDSICVRGKAKSR